MRQPLSAGVRWLTMTNTKTIIDFWPEVENAKIVYDFYKKWPTLHDAEIIEINLNRELGFDFTGPKIQMTLHWCADWLSDKRSIRKGSKIVLVFERTELQTIKDFNHQNAIADFIMRKFYSKRLRQHRYKIAIGEFGTKMQFTCSAVKVVSIAKYVPPDYFKKNI